MPTLFSSFCGKLFKSIYDALILWEPFKDYEFNLNSLNCILMIVTLRAYISFIQCWFSIKEKCWFRFPLKFSCQSKLFQMFGSHSKFKIWIFLDYNELQQLVFFHTISISKIQWPFPIIFFWRKLHIQY